MSSTVVHVRQAQFFSLMYRTDSDCLGQEHRRPDQRKRGQRLLQLLVGLTESQTINGSLLTSSSGKITSLSVTPSSEAKDSPQSATVTFEKETYVKLPHLKAI